MSSAGDRELPKSQKVKLHGKVVEDLRRKDLASLVLESLRGLTGLRENIDGWMVYRRRGRAVDSAGSCMERRSFMRYEAA